MKDGRNSMKASVLGVGMALVFVLAGLMVPMTLLKKQEAEYLGVSTRTTVQQAPMTIEPEPTPLPQTQHKLKPIEIELYRSLLEEFTYGALTLREPCIYELGMDRAERAAIDELEILIGAGALPELGTGGLRLRSAELYGRTVLTEPEGNGFPPAFGVWSITFEDTEGAWVCSLVCDSQTALILCVDSYCEPSDADPAESFYRLMRFAEYFGCGSYSFACEYDGYGAAYAVCPFAEFAVYRRFDRCSLRLSGWDRYYEGQAYPAAGIYGPTPIPSPTPDLPQKP